MKIKQILITLLVVGFAAFTGVSGYFVGFRGGYNLREEQYQEMAQQYDVDGESVFEAVNEYREEHNLNTVELDPALCNNLAERYEELKTDFSHDGFEEWAKEVGIYNTYEWAELIARDAYRPQDVIQIWEESPGHNLALTDSKYNVACTYANQGISVLVLGKKI